MLTGVDACAGGDHDDVSMCGRGCEFVDQERSLQLHGRVVRILYRIKSTARL